eukprot:3776228-Amphidinium_carterae.1
MWHTTIHNFHAAAPPLATIQVPTIMEDSTTSTGSGTNLLSQCKLNYYLFGYSDFYIESEY